MTVCITTVADGEYQRFIPLWALCILRAYPSYSVRAFVPDEPCAELTRGLGLLEYAGDFEVITGGFDGYWDTERLGAHLRFFLFTEDRLGYWRGFDYVYITDADMLITRQEPPLHEQHIRHMEVTGLPYSAMMRAGEPNVVTALLFASQAFIQAVAPTASRYDLAYRTSGLDILDTAKRIPDERLLYQIIRDSGVGLPPQHDPLDDPLGLVLSDPASYEREVFRPWHGINIGAAQAGSYGMSARPRLPYTQDAVQQIDALLQSDSLAQECCLLMTPRQQWMLADIIESTGARA